MANERNSEFSLVAIKIVSFRTDGMVIFHIVKPQDGRSETPKISVAEFYGGS